MKMLLGRNFHKIKSPNPIPVAIGIKSQRSWHSNFVLGSLEFEFYLIRAD